MKLQTAAALSASGYFCGLNVNLSATSEKGFADITDVDVLAVRHDVTFAPRFIAVSCKSGGKLSVAREIFYLRGVLTFFAADEGVAMFAQRAVPQQLRDLGRQLDILVLSGDEADRWRASLTNGLQDPGYFREGQYDLMLSRLAAAGSETLLEFLKVDYWFYRDFRNLQRLVGFFRRMAPRLTGASDWHAVVFLSAAAHLCLTILDLCRNVRMLGVAGVEEVTPTYLFGGATSYRARRDLYTKVDQMLRESGMVTKAGPKLPPLEPVYTPALAELAIRFVERPHAAVRVPQMLQDRLWQLLGAPGLQGEEGQNTLAAEKLAQDLLDFLRSATGAPWSPQMFEAPGTSSSYGSEASSATPASAAGTTEAPKGDLGVLEDASPLGRKTHLPPATDS